MRVALYRARPTPEGGRAAPEGTHPSRSAKRTKRPAGAQHVWTAPPKRSRVQSHFQPTRAFGPGLPWKDPPPVGRRRASDPHGAGGGCSLRVALIAAANEGRHARLPGAQARADDQTMRGWWSGQAKTPMAGPPGLIRITRKNASTEARHGRPTDQPERRVATRRNDQRVRTFCMPLTAFGVNRAGKEKLVGTRLTPPLPGPLGSAPISGTRCRFPEGPPFCTLRAV